MIIECNSCGSQVKLETEIALGGRDEQIRIEEQQLKDRLQQRLVAVDKLKAVLNAGDDMADALRRMGYPKTAETWTQARWDISKHEE